MTELLNVENYLGPLTYGTFKERINRFTVKVDVEGREFLAHLSDTGRLKELLTPGSPVALALNPRGKLDFKLVSIKADEWVFLYTPLHSRIAEKLIRRGILGFKPKDIKKEVKVGNSRIDFLVDNNFFIEVKGCNLKIGNTCLFPDAPTKRGRKHVEELISLQQKGYPTAILFLLFRNCSHFKPNAAIDPDFYEAYRKARKSGTQILTVNLFFLQGRLLLKGYTFH